MYFTNLAFANYKLENYGLTLLNATEAIKTDPEYAKSYYRRGSAYIALSHFDEAIKDFKKVVKMCPSDKDAKAKLDLAKQQKHSKLFAECIAKDDEKIELDPNTLSDSSSYSGPKLIHIDEINSDWCLEAMKWMKD